MKTGSCNLLLVFFAMLLLSSCLGKKGGEPYFPGPYPGKAEALLQDSVLRLSNAAISADWVVRNNTLCIRGVKNFYDGSAVDLSAFILFGIETGDGTVLTNRDFTLSSAPELRDLPVSDSVPAGALRFPGRELVAGLHSSSSGLDILWRAQLRDGSNYIRQNITVTSADKPVKIRRVIFLRGDLEGAAYAGMVIGSPVTCRNFFFGFEHPVALSGALLARNAGPVSSAGNDLTGIIDSAGEYLLTIEPGSSSEWFDIKSVSLLVNGKTVSTDSHPYLGSGGSGTYRLLLKDYIQGAEYRLQYELINPAAANGDFHICRKTGGLVDFYVNRSDELTRGKAISEWAVIGVTPEGQQRRSFLYYLERERAHPYRQFLHYNCWWDITTDGASSFSSEQVTERMKAWNEKFMVPYGIKLKSFVFDDGWDNVDSVWYFDPARFPEGFRPEAELCRKFGSGIGVWMSPFGGYGYNKERRLISGRRQGLEINDKGLSLSGPNYYNRFLKRACDMLDNYKVNYFKFDGFGGSEPKYLPDMEAGARLITTLRQHNPDVFINITVGSWPSPFWLRYADCTWRGSGDLHNAGKGTRTARFMTYRDGTLHDNIVAKAPFYPLNSIMTVGIAYANNGLPAMYINDSINDFRDMVWSYFGSGSALQELYISHDRMKPEFWKILADAALWSQENSDVLHDTHWIGGSPLNMEVYGFASWTPRKGIIVLRNPDSEPASFGICPASLFELPVDYRAVFRLVPVRDDFPSGENVKIAPEETRKIMLRPYELKIFEAVPE